MKQNYILSVSEEGFHHVAYSDWGHSTDSSSAVLCVHGLARNSHDFDSLARFLSLQGNRVVCPDIVGRGDSSWFKNPQHYNFQQYVIDMTVLIARIGVTEIDWVGTSMGGIIGMMMAALPHSPVRRLILNDIGPQIPIHGLWRLGKYVGQGTEFTSKKEAKEYFQKIYSDFGSLTDEQWNEFTEHSIEQRSPGIYVIKLDPSIKESRTHRQIMKDFLHNPFKALEGILFDIDFWSVWNNIKCPVLVIHGKHSDLLLPKHIKKMQDTHYNVEVLEVEDAGHAPALLDKAQHEKIAHWLSQEIFV